jgi:hypothetical protein
MTCSSSLRRSRSTTSPAALPQQQQMNDKVWRPMPYIPAVYDGFDQTSNFGDITQLSVPVSVGIHKVTPIKIGPKDGRDKANIQRYFRDAALSLASQVNLSVFNRASTGRRWSASAPLRQPAMTTSPP